MCTSVKDLYTPSCPPGCAGGVDHRAEVHGRLTGAQESDGDKRRQREDPRHDEDLRDPRKEDVQERAAGAAGGGGGERVTVF